MSEIDHSEWDGALPIKFEGDHVGWYDPATGKGVLFEGFAERLFPKRMEGLSVDLIEHEVAPVLSTPYPERPSGPASPER